MGRGRAVWVWALTFGTWGWGALCYHVRQSVSVTEGNCFLATHPGCALRKPGRIARISRRAIFETFTWIMKARLSILTTSPSCCFILIFYPEFHKDTWNSITPSQGPVEVTRQHQLSFWEHLSREVASASFFLSIFPDAPLYHPAWLLPPCTGITGFLVSPSLPVSSVHMEPSL